MAGRGELHLRCRRGPLGTILLEVEDHGCGISPQDLPKIFQPFFTTKGSGRGTGLGLALVDRVVRDLDGHLEVHSVVGVGTLFALTLAEVEPSEGEEDGTKREPA